MNIRLRLSVVVAVFALLMGCTPSTKHPSEDGVLRIATTIAPTVDLIRQIGGDSIESVVLLPEGATPESYEPTPQTLEALAGCDAYFYVGDLGFEYAWLDRIKELYPHLKLIRLDEGLKHILTDHVCVDPKHTHRADPHYWMSWIGIQTMSTNVMKGLAELNPSKQEDYMVNLQMLEQGVIQPNLDRDYNLSGATRPKGFVIYHPSLSYLAQELDLEQLVVEYEGKEPSPRQLETLITRARELGVTTVFLQREFNPQLTYTIAQELGVPIVTINPFDRDWLSQLQGITTALVGE